jgi:hypothetical protein
MRLSRGGRLELLVGADIYLALLFFIFSDCVGVNDPHVMAQVVMAAMAVYVGNTKGTSTLVFAVALIAIKRLFGESGRLVMLYLGASLVIGTSLRRARE